MELEFDEIYKRFFKDVYLFVLAMSKDPHIAEEITQDTFFKALKEIKHFQGNCSVKSWLCQIAKNLYISYTARKRQSIRTVLNSFPMTRILKACASAKTKPYRFIRFCTAWRNLIKRYSSFVFWET